MRVARSAKISQMLKHGGGSVIFTSTFAGYTVAFPGVAAYAALKSGTLVRLLEAFEPQPVPVHLMYADQGQIPLKLRAFIDFAVPRLRERLGLASAASQMSARSTVSKTVSWLARAWYIRVRTNLEVLVDHGMEHRLVYLLNVGQRRLQRWSQARVAGGGVTAAQSGLLFFLGGNDGALMSEAAAALDLGAPGMSGLADRTERAGLIERRPDESDRRVSRLWLTEAGRAARQHSKVSMKALNAKLTKGFTEAEIDIVARWLTSLQTKFPATDNGEA